MYKKTTNSIFSFIIFLLCLPAYAVQLPSANSAPYTDYYGKVDAIYSKEHQIIINDISIRYNHKSKFIDAHRNHISDIDNSVKQGLYVKYHIAPKGESQYLLLDLQLVSEAEIHEIETRGYDD